MSNDIKKIILVFVISNLVGLIGVSIFVNSNKTDLAYVLMGAGILLHILWFIMLVVFIIKKWSNKTHLKL